MKHLECMLEITKPITCLKAREIIRLNIRMII